MTRRVDTLVERFGDVRVLVLGDAILDRYLDGHTTGICREGPVPTVALDRRRDVPGGAGNTAANLAALGGQVTLLAVTGDDLEAETLAATLRDRGVAFAPVTQPRRRSMVKHRLSAGDQLLARYDAGDSSGVAPPSRQRLVRRLSREWRVSDAVVVADYGLGVCTPAVVEAVAALQADQPRVLTVDSRSPARYRAIGATAVKPNYREALSLLADEPGDAGERAEFIEARAEQLLAAAGAGMVVVTLDVDGIVVLERGRAPQRIAARPTPSRRAAGAGDTFTAALTLALAAGADSATAAEVASSAAAVAVGKPHTAVCGLHELQLGLLGGSKRLSGPEALAAHVAVYRQRGHQIVFTNGCFDLLHRGHVAYLNRAKLLGDVLVVAVNSDQSVARLKGPGRPITPLEDRLQVLAALGCVDHVVAFDGDSPLDLLRAACPDIYVKGGDYTRQMLPETPVVEELGGRIQLLSYVSDRSTSGIIELIRGRSPDGQVSAG